MCTEKLASLRQLAAGIAHELNNPLGTILLYSGLIERKLGSGASLSNDIGLIQRETQRCKRIVAGLLNFARQNRMHFSRCRLNEFTAEVIGKSFDAEALAEKKIQLSFVEAKAEAIDADIDRDQMTQVLVNLVQNGIEALGEEGGSVEVSLSYSEERDRVRLAVRDNGCGIPPEDHDRVFQPFFTTKNIGAYRAGSGYNVRHCQNASRFHMVRIDPGCGATFIELPVSQARQIRSMT